MNFFKNKRLLVTGATGLVGANLLRRLAPTGARIRAVYHRRKPVIKASNIDYIKADLTVRSSCDKAVTNIDYLFHCAANTSGAAVVEKTPLAHVTPNIVMNAQLLEAAWLAKVQKFLWLSSTTGYPPTGARPVKEDEIFDGEPYEKYYPVGWMKRYTEVLCRLYGEKLNRPMTTIVLRPTNIYGDYDDYRFETSHVTAALVRRVVERHDPLVVWGDGKDVRDIIHVADFVEAMVVAMEKVDKHAVFNIGFGKSYSIREILQKLLEIDGYKECRVVYDRAKPRMIPVRNVDLTRMKKVLGFSPKISLEEGLRRALTWYRGHPV